ncbi:zinc-binding dehydrogenase [Novosphingopyxis sp.]|uniref:zinc-binding dehydrogenase n=1 Tax=Novosphingopyxis sp. TaxID=2709690 RepID=UPI003B59D56D
MLVDRSASSCLVVREVSAPTPGVNEALVRVASVSLTLDEIESAVQSAPDGAQLGHDFAGVVETAAKDGSGPATGARVLGLVRTGALKERVAVSTNALATIPDKVGFSYAAALPTSGLTALRTLGQAGGLLTAKRVLITASSDHVGLIAVQLARASGACVSAAVPSREHEVLLEDYGADHVIVGDLAGASEFGPYDIILHKNVDSPLETAANLLRPGGVCVLRSVSVPRSVPTGVLDLIAARRGRLRGFSLTASLRREPAAEALNRLSILVATRSITPHVEVEASWTAVALAVKQMRRRDHLGRCVLHL